MGVQFFGEFLNFAAGWCVSTLTTSLGVFGHLSIKPEFDLESCTNMAGTGTLVLTSDTSLRRSSKRHLLWPTSLSLKLTISISSNTAVDFPSPLKIPLLIFEGPGSEAGFPSGSGTIRIDRVLFSPGTQLVFTLPSTSSQTLEIGLSSPVNATGVTIRVVAPLSTGTIATKLIGFNSTLLT